MGIWRSHIRVGTFLLAVCIFGECPHYKAELWEYGAAIFEWAPSYWRSVFSASAHIIRLNCGNMAQPYSSGHLLVGGLYFRRVPTIHNILCSVENLTTTNKKNLRKSAFCGIFPLTFADRLVYNTTLSGCMCVFAHLYSTTLIDRKGEQRHVPYLPAQEASSQDGARFPQENGYCQRPQGSGS